jgi:integrase
MRLNFLSFDRLGILRVDEKKHGIKKDFHSFRHTVVNTLKQNLVDEKLINAIIGHADQSMSTGRYGDPFHPRVLIDVIQQLDFEDCLSEVKPYLTLCKR